MEPNDVIGMVFAAGLGTRLRPLTDNCPKALIEVGGVPMLERVLLSMKESGIRRAVVNVHHHAPMIKDFLKARDNMGLEIAVSDESDLLLDTGGGIAKAAPLLTSADAVVLHNADIYTDMPLHKLMDAHHTDATLAAWHRDSSRALLFDNDNLLRGWINRHTGQLRPEHLDTSELRELAFGGIHMIDRSVVERICAYRPSGTPFSITDFYIDNCGELAIGAYTPEQPFTWHDIGRIDTLRLLQASRG